VAAAQEPCATAAQHGAQGVPLVRQNLSRGLEARGLAPAAEVQASRRDRRAREAKAAEKAAEAEDEAEETSKKRKRP